MFYRLYESFTVGYYIDIRIGSYFFEYFVRGTCVILVFQLLHIVNEFRDCTYYFFVLFLFNNSNLIYVLVQPFINFFYIYI